MYLKPVLGLAEVMAALNAMAQEATKDPARPVAFAIVDDNGDLLAYAQMDNVAGNPRQVAIRKAYTAARMRANTLALADRFNAQQGRSIKDFGDPNLLAIQGGIVVTRPGDGAALGGIGVSGRPSHEDEALAKVGLAAMNLGE